MLDAFKMALAVVVGLLFVGLGIGSNIPMPPHALVYLHDDTRTFFAAPCLQAWQARGLTPDSIRAGSYGEARRNKFFADKACLDTGAHYPEGRNATGHLLEALGLLPPLSAHEDDRPRHQPPLPENMNWFFSDGKPTRPSSGEAFESSGQVCHGHRAFLRHAAEGAPHSSFIR